MKYDFIVIGGGVSGSYFADLASEYSSVLLIEKKPFERQNFSGGIFCAHNFPYFDKNHPLPLDNTQIFPCDSNEIVYSGKTNDGIVSGPEFGTPLGKLCNLGELNKFLNKRAESHGAVLEFNATVDNVSIERDEGVVVRCANGKKFRSDVVLIATGSGDLSQIATDEKNTHKRSFWIQNSLGFQHPDLYFGATLRYEGDENTINENIPHEYYYHYNRKINPFGPLYTIHWDNHFDIGILHQSYEMAVNRLVAVIQRYKRVEPYFRGVKPMEFPSAQKVDGFPILKVGISKHPVKKKSKSRALLLGEAAGLVTELFYEGVCGGVVSAKIASDILQPLKENSDAHPSEVEKYSDKPECLGKYDARLDKILVNTYLKSSHGSETLFLNSGDAGEVIFDYYCDLLSKNKQLRKCVYDAMVLNDLSQYNFDNDKFTGEEILKALPLPQKVLYTPIFLKAMMS